MRAKYLRIGNLVSIDNKIEEVKELKGHTRNGLINLVFGEKVNPIKLTDEWWLKFGFNLKDLQINGFKIFNYGDGKYYLCNESVGGKGRYIKYVHELQNLNFSLKNKELKL